MPVDWNKPENERLLLLALLNREQKGGWDKIAKMLGPDLTSEAVRQKFYKLKRESEALIAQGDSTAATNPTPTSTKKKAGNMPKASTPTTNKGRKRNAETVIKVDSGDDEVKETPTKKSKTNSTKDKHGGLFNDEAFEQIRNGDDED